MTHARVCLFSCHSRQRGRIVRDPMGPASPQGTGLSMEQFVDFCILCGCDYVNNIRGIGPVKALQLIQKHGSIEVMGKR